MTREEYRRYVVPELTRRVEFEHARRRVDQYWIFSVAGVIMPNPYYNQSKRDIWNELEPGIRTKWDRQLTKKVLKVDWLREGF